MHGPWLRPGPGVPFKTPHMPSGDALRLLKMHIAKMHPPAAPPTATSCTLLTDSVKLSAVPSISAEDTHGLFSKSMPEGGRIKSSAEAAIKPATTTAVRSPQLAMRSPQYELPKSPTKADKLECTFPTCDRGDGDHYKKPKLAVELALALLREHRAEIHHPPAPSSYTPLTDIVKLPAVPSTTAEDPYGLLFTKSLPEEIRIKSSAEASTMPVNSNVTRRTNKAAKKARQRAASTGPRSSCLPRPRQRSRSP